jgi:hypothetical protein
MRKIYEINLTDAEVKLLLLILEEAEDNRACMCCNDPDGNEEELFTADERILMQMQMNTDEPEEDIDGFLFNNQYVQYIKDRIEQQIKE